MNKLINEIVLTEDLEHNAEDLDKQVLREALEVKEEQFSQPMDGASLLLMLAEEGLL